MLSSLVNNFFPVFLTTMDFIYVCVCFNLLVMAWLTEMFVDSSQYPDMKL